jgi:lipid-binding SYLF domain-containing protein
MGRRGPAYRVMKTNLLIGTLVLCATVSAFGVERAELDNRVQTLTAKLEAMQRQPDKRIPADALNRARGIILLDRTKAGFIFAYQGGGGVALVKDPKTDLWSPAAFVGATEASLGFQIGGEQAFYAILLMTTNATEQLTAPKIDFGGEARGTGGNSSAGVEGKVPIPDSPVLVYSDRKGLYGGAVIKGGAIAPDDGANRAYYGEPVNMRDILFDHKVTASETTVQLTRKLTDYSKPPPEISRKSRD